MKNIFLLAVLLIIGCDSTPKVDVVIRSKDYKGQTVPEAKITINGKDVGFTSREGTWQQVMEFDVNSKFHVKVKKEDKNSYFEPYEEVIQIGEQKRQSVVINATFYSVPKKIDSSEMGLNEKNEENVAKKEVTDIKDNEEKNDESELLPQSEVLDDLVPDSDGINSEKVTQVAKENYEESQKTANKPSESIKNMSLPKETVVEKRPLPLDSEKNNEVMFFVHTKSKNKKIAGVEVKVLDAKNIVTSCITGETGRCMLRMPDNSRDIQLTLNKPGYQSQTHKRRVSHQENLYFDIRKGRSIEFHAKTVLYDRSYALNGIDIYVDGRHIGKTDSSGHILFPLNKTQDDQLISVSMKSQTGFPNVYETGFVADKNVSIIHNFQPRHPPKMNVVVLPLDKNMMGSGKAGQIENKINKILKNSKSIRDIPLMSFKRALSRQGITVHDAINKGWGSLSKELRVDGVVSVEDAEGIPQIVMVNRLGVIQSASMLQNNIDRGIREFLISLPFEGIITQKVDELYQLNIGPENGAKIGRKVNVYGTQKDNKGNKQEYKVIATAEIVSVNSKSSNIRVLSKKPRTMLSLGQRVKLVSVKHQIIAKSEGKTNKNYEIVVLDEFGKSRIQGVNVYSGNKWIGTTDRSGTIFVGKNDINSSQVKGFKEGFKTLVINMTSKSQMVVRMKQIQTKIHLETIPSGLEVQVDDKSLGKSPLHSAVIPKNAWVKLVVKGPSGYRDFEQIMEIESNGTLDLTGPRSVQMEVDYRGLAQKMLDSGKIEKALKKLESIPKNHTDYLLAWHDIGRIYWMLLDKPAKAASAFHKVTSNLEVQSFRDKRFITSHVSEGVSLYEAAEKLPDSAANAHYQKAFEILEKVRPYMRFVPRGERNRLKAMSGFYRLASLQKIWEKTGDGSLYPIIKRGWEEYVGYENYEESYLESARVFSKKLDYEKHRLGL